jgi:hypothetical protein
MSMEVAGIPARGLEGNQTAPPPVLEVGKVHQEEKSSLCGTTSRSIVEKNFKI